LEKDLAQLEKKMDDAKLEEAYYNDCHKRFELEQKIKQTANAARKEVQRQLDTIKNRMFGPKWTTSWTNYNLQKTLQKEYNVLLEDKRFLESHKDTIVPAINFLNEIGYLSNTDPLTLKNEDLTLKGILATEINEGHQIIMTELYTRQMLHSLSGEDLVTVLACFEKEKDDDNSPFLSELDISQAAYDIIKSTQELVKEFERLEERVGYPIHDYWNISLKMVEPMRRWIQGENASIICQEYELFEGNFIRSVMKMTNMLDEWLAMATYCQHTEQIDKIMEVRSCIVRDIVISDSLYLHL
jgi:superfamily II RNA helicase